MPKVTRVEQAVPVFKRKKRVAAYARVSVEAENTIHSFSAQVSYYSSLIQNNPGWEYAGVFADNGISGTGIGKRTDFLRMLEAADNGKIDIILTKSIQRFARNTVDLLETVRHLKDIGVEVRFEKEHINSLSGDGELMLTVLASFAQEESRSISENTKWAIRKRFQKGIPGKQLRVYGYRWEGDGLVIVQEEAEVVRRIFRNYLAGKSKLDIMAELAAEEITTRSGKPWSEPGIKVMLTNVTYTGNLLLQKWFTVDPITKYKKKNRGELPQYYVEDAHPAIIDKATFDAVQAEIARRKALGPLANKSLNTCCFTGKLRCPACGKNYARSRHTSNPKRVQDIWICSTRRKKGGRCSIGGVINHVSLERACIAVLGMDGFDEDVFREKVDFIIVPRRNVLEFHLKDGSVVTKDCPNTGNKDRWTQEEREKVAEAMRKENVRRKKEREKACCKEK